MASLERTLRRQLENTVKQARRVAEAGVWKALESLAVHHHEPHSNMSPEQRALRNRLRAHGRQLGDQRDDRRGTQTIVRLVGECAYEHWHRMLFARFLAENDLLIEPESGVAITLGECQELAREQGQEWLELASSYAVRMLPQVFRPDDPVLEVVLSPETTSALEDLLKKLPCDVFTASDSLGWCYQFWQAERKDEVNASGNKIGADELPAVTQLFTEDYMVDFLLDNTLGAWHAGKVLAANPELAKSAQNEEELRTACAVGDVRWAYLRFVKVEAASSRFQQGKEASASSRFEETRQDGASTFFDPASSIEDLSGNLPHWRQEGTTYFVTFRTADSVPQDKLRAWEEEREIWMEKHPEPHDEATRREYCGRFNDRFHEWLDAGHGACLLAQPELKQAVEDALRHFDGQRYRLDEFVVMQNHVHALVTPINGHELSDILHSWKSFTANEINKKTGRTGALWQKESFDHIVRSPQQLERIRQYIRENPKVDAASSRVQPGHEASASRSVEETRQDGASTLWAPAAGTFDGWPRAAKDVTCLDPCMGSGHFVVAMFERLVALRMAEEELDEASAVAAVIRDNLFGLEIDPRCTQIGAFNLALAAWRRVGYCTLPPMHIACSGLAPNTREADWLAMVDAASSRIPEDQRQDAAATMRLRAGMARLYRLFQNAPVLGSLINPRAGEGDLLVAAFHELQPLLAKALEVEEASSLFPDQNGKRLEGSATAQDLSAEASAKAEMAVTARGLAKAAEILAGQFTLVATNVPYLGRGKQDEVLQDYCERVHPEAKADLATCFVERCLDFSAGSGSTSLVTPQNWLFIGTYEKLRCNLLRHSQFDSVSLLGPRAFETIGGEVVNVALVAITRNLPTPEQEFTGVDVINEQTPLSKREGLLCKAISKQNQAKQLRNPDSRITLESLRVESLLEKCVESLQGISTGDNPRLNRKFWETPQLLAGWEHLQASTEDSMHYGGRGHMVWLSELESNLEDLGGALRGRQAWKKRGVSVNRMTDLAATLMTGEIFDINVAVLLPKKPEYLVAVYAFCVSPLFNQAVRQLDKKAGVTNATLGKVHFDLAHWQKVAAEKYPDGLPKPFSSDPTQWLFNGHPAGADQPLHVAVARLLGYQWPRQTGSSFPDCPALGPDGLETLADEDGIVCLSATKGEAPAAARLRTLLATAFGSEWSVGKERELLSAAGSKKTTLEDWLLDEFFEQHSALFHHRPFIWHIWDGLRDGFNALVNYHRLAEGRSGILPLSEQDNNAAGSRVYSGRRTLEKLIYTYLGDWITQQRRDQQAQVEGADARLAAALHLQDELKKILEGEPPYDFFVRWKPLHEQPIGWEPDINDGVRLNIRPFMTARPANARAKNACILRTTPKNIKWTKDRGKEPERPREDYPWFWGWDEKTQDFAGGAKFDGDRWNDLHYSNAYKQSARDRQKEER